jgi:hypothetical protein
VAKHIQSELERFSRMVAYRDDQIKRLEAENDRIRKGIMSEADWNKLTMAL